MQLIDLSQTIGPGVPMFSEQAPQPEITPWLSHAQAAFSGRYTGLTMEITEIRMVTAVGTYLDSPFHGNAEGASIDRLDLDQLVLPGIVVRCREAQSRQELGPELIEGLDCAGKAVLFATSWSAYWTHPATYVEHPFIGAELALALRESGARLVGIDVLNADDRENPRRPAHATLLMSNILIVENLTNLEALPDEGFTFHAVPAKIAGVAAFPVRAYGLIPNLD